MPTHPTVQDYLGAHPAESELFGGWLGFVDTNATTGVPHRELAQSGPEPIAEIRKVVRKHHATFEQVAEARRQRQLIKKYKKKADLALTRLLPVTDSTRKGNLAEILLAEYIVESTEAEVPIYRLRYNPNIDQSMKGDDVLAFDFAGDRTRIIVGEAKFRTTPSAAVVREIAEALLRSHKAKMPASLTFVANRLVDLGSEELAKKVRGCVEQFIKGSLTLDYIGLLMSSPAAAEHVNAATPAKPKRLVMISLGVERPSQLVNACYREG